jgi:C-terminal processing protease CtpA/Prc
MMKALLFLILLFPLYVWSQPLTKEQYREDFSFFWQTIRDDYSYWDQKQTDWNKVHRFFEAQLDTISSKKSFVGLLERVLYQLYDHHASLNTNTQESQRLVPSGTDLWAEFRNGQPQITQVLANSVADRAGMRPGMVLLEFNGLKVSEAIRPFLPCCLKKPDSAAFNYALRVLLAGTHQSTRHLKLRQGNQEKVLILKPESSIQENLPMIESRVLENGIGYIRILNRLGDNGLIKLFDSVLKNLSASRALILDLRSTPGGGNTTVARSILGSFITREGFYQKHELPAEEKQWGIKRSWMEIVSPRDFVYRKPLVILLDHWTGSVGEGIAIGFDGLKRATIIGTPMAGLNGANYSYRLKHSGIGFSFPAEKLFHINGSPRETFIPGILVDLAGQKPGEDRILKKAMEFLQ